MTLFKITGRAVGDAVFFVEAPTLKEAFVKLESSPNHYSRSGKTDNIREVVRDSLRVGVTYNEDSVSVSMVDEDDCC